MFSLSATLSPRYCGSHPCSNAPNRAGSIIAGRHGVAAATSPDLGPFSCPIPQRQAHVINLDGAHRFRCLTQSKIVVTRPPSIFRPLHQPLPHGIQLFQQAMPWPSREEPTVTRGRPPLRPADFQPWRHRESTRCGFRMNSQDKSARRIVLLFAHLLTFLIAGRFRSLPKRIAGTAAALRIADEYAAFDECGNITQGCVVGTLCELRTF